MNSENQYGEFHIKRLNGDNLADVEELYAAVYGRIAPPNLFSGKYNTSFMPVQYAGFIAYNNQKMPVAFYGAIPCFIQFEDKNIPAAQSADAMTHPQYRNKGLFIKLALSTCQLCLDSGIHLIFGFPNQNSLPGFINKLGWQRTEDMACFIIPCAVFSWKRFFGKSPLLRNWYKNYQQKELKKYLISQQGIPNSVFNDGCPGVFRDQAYLSYKTYTHNQVIKIGNATLWIKINGVLLIGDILVNPVDFEDTMHKLKNLARKIGVKEIHFHSSPGTSLYNLFASRFNSIPSFPVIFKDFTGGIQTDKIKFTSADIDTF